MKCKLLAFLTAAVLAIGIMPTGITIAKEDSATDRAVKLLSALGVMETDSYTGKFWDDTPVERWEMAKIMCDLFKSEPITDNEPRFTDVYKEYRPYVETAVRNGYMSGYSDDEFGANEYITGEQLVKIFVSVLGADKQAEMSGGFPDGYVYTARKIGLLNGMTLDYKADARRIDAARLIYSAMHTDITELVGMSGGKEIFNSSEGKTFLTERLNIYCFDGIINQNEATSLDCADGAGAELGRIGDILYKDPKRITDDYFGYNARIYVHKPSDYEMGEVVYAEEKIDNRAVVVEDKDFINIDRYNVSFYSGEKRRNLTLSAVTNMIYNGKAIDYDSSRLYVKNGYAKYIDNDGNGTYDVIIINDYSTFVVGGVDAENKTITFKFGEGKLNLEEDFFRISEGDEKLELKDIPIGSVVLAAISDNSGKNVGRWVEIHISTKNVMGSAERIFSKDGFRYVTVKGNDYKIGEYCERLIKDKNQDEITTRSSGRFFMDERGNIAYASLNNVGISVGYLIDSTFEETPFSTRLKSKIYTSDGKIEIFSTGDTVTIDEVKKSVSDFAGDYSVKGKLKSPQLILYSVTDGILKEMDFPENGYDKDKFSMDVNGVYRCTRPSIIDNKYIVPTSTQVFYVPSLSSSAPDYEEQMNNPSNYAIYGGGHFSAGNFFGLALYDINEDGEARYAVSKKDPTTGNINEGTQSIIVTSVGEGINKNGETATMIIGLNESGEETTLLGAEAEEIIDGGLNRGARIGDVIQYYTNPSGELLQIQIQHDAESSEYYKPKAYESTKSDYTVTKAYGEVMSINGSSLRLTCKPISAAMTVLDGDMYIADTGKAIYRVDKARKEVYKVKFDEIEKGDKVFACVNRQNYTRMLVVYE